MPHKNPMVRKKYARTYYRQYYHRKNLREYSNAQARKHAEHRRQYKKNLIQKHRLIALTHYSGGVTPFCSCCRETILRFMTIDHINGGGAKHQKTISSLSFFTWLIKNNFPDGFRVLCYNCNIGRAHNGGTCPHEENSQ